MANGEQLAMALEKAKLEVAEHGYEGADLKAVMLAGFGYLADSIRASDSGVIRIKLEGKKMFVLGSGVGGSVVGAVIKLLGL